MNCNRNGYASNFFQSHWLDIITDSVDCQTQEYVENCVLFYLAETRVANFKTTHTFLTLKKGNLTRYEKLILTAFSLIHCFY